MFVEKQRTGGFDRGSSHREEPRKIVFDTGYSIDLKKMELGIFSSEQLLAGIHGLASYVSKSLFLNNNEGLFDINNDSRLSTKQIFFALQSVDHITTGISTAETGSSDIGKKIDRMVEDIRPMMQRISSIISSEQIDQLTLQARFQVVALIERMTISIFNTFSIRSNKENKKLTDPKAALERALARDGFIFPDSSREGIIPGEYLIRGESDANRLIGQDPMVPRAGKFGTQGVYLGDNLGVLMHQSSGVLYLFKRDVISLDWLSDHVETGNQLIAMIEEYGRKHGINTATMLGWDEASKAVYKEYFTYESKSGIATSPIPLNIAHAEKIYITPDLATADFLSHLDESILKKIVVLQ